MIHVVDDWYIDVDDYQYILKKDLYRTRIDKKTGKESNEYKIAGYYSSLSKALDGLGKKSSLITFRVSPRSLQRLVRASESRLIGGNESRRISWRHVIYETRRTANRYKAHPACGRGIGTESGSVETRPGQTWRNAGHDISGQRASPGRDGGCLRNRSCAETGSHDY